LAATVTTHVGFGEVAQNRTLVSMPWRSRQNGDQKLDANLAWTIVQLNRNGMRSARVDQTSGSSEVAMTRLHAELHAFGFINTTRKGRAAAAITYRQWLVHIDSDEAGHWSASNSASGLIG
jgi:hypothetical protein